MTHRWLTSTLIAVTAACGSKPPPEPTYATTEPMTTPPPAAVAFEITATAELAALILIPEALTNLEWPAPPIDRSVATQRRRFTAAGPDARQREAAELATALWYSAPSDSEPERAARDEARIILREVAAAGGASETVLAMLTVAERSLGDVAASEKLYDELILRFPQSTRAWRYRAVRAWLDLRAQQNKRAAEIVTGADLAAEATPSAVHYVAGWIALRDGDPTRAHASLVTAIQRWGDLWSWDTVRNEAFLLGALAGATPDYMRQVLAEIVKGPPRREAGTTNKRIRTVVRSGKRTTVIEESSVQYSKEWLHLELGRAYARWGRTAEAAEVFEHALGGDPHTDAAVERELMLLAAAANQPAAVAGHAEAATAALARAVTDSTAADLRELETALTGDLARLATQYGAFADVTALAEYRGAAAILAGLAAVELAPPAELTPDVYRSAVVEAQLAWSRPRLVACYLAPLQSQARFDGAVVLELVPGPDGVAALVSVAPAEGDGGLAAVAGCVARVAADWRLTAAPGAARTAARVELRFAPRP